MRPFSAMAFPLICGAALLALPGCGNGSTEWKELVPANFSVEQKKLQDRALTAQKALADGLQQKLMAALESGSPADAISVCQTEAPKIAKVIAEEQKVKIGRTSFKLRNGKNLAPDWATAFVKERRSEAVWLVGRDQKMAGLLPIRLQPQCLVCHGPKETIAPETIEALQKNYPDDKATGFKDGELRGWFWVEAGP